MKKVLAVALLLAFAIPAAAQTAPRKKRVAILDFEYGTVRTAVAGLFGTDVDVGKGMSDLLVKHLVKDGTYSVIERKMLDKILAEQNFSNSDRVDANSAAKIGRILGVDAIIMGSITQFGRDDKSTNVGAGAFGDFGRKVGIGGVGRWADPAVDHRQAVSRDLSPLPRDPFPEAPVVIVIARAPVEAHGLALDSQRPPERA